MGFFRSGKFRFLYLLALLQLVGGPLVLLNVMLFSKLVIHEAPRVGIMQAVSVAWDSHDVQESIIASMLPGKNAMETCKKEGKAKPDFSHFPDFPWLHVPPKCADKTAVCGVPGHFQIWTPQWPHAPPAPPPRIG